MKPRPFQTHPARQIALWQARRQIHLTRACFLLPCWKEAWRMGVRTHMVPNHTVSSLTRKDNQGRSFQVVALVTRNVIMYSQEKIKHSMALFLDYPGWELAFLSIAPYEVFEGVVGNWWDTEFSESTLWQECDW